MPQNRMNSSYSQFLLDKEIEDIDNAFFSSFQGQNMSAFDYDDRVNWVKSLVNSLLYSTIPFQEKDLKFFFPELVNSDNLHQVIDTQKLDESIECVIAEMMGAF